MSLTAKQYIDELYRRVVERNANEPEFHQTVQEVYVIISMKKKSCPHLKS